MPKEASKLSCLGEDFFLHEVDTHGDDAHAQQDVDRPQHQLGICFLLSHIVCPAVDV